MKESERSERWGFIMRLRLRWAMIHIVMGDGVRGYFYNFMGTKLTAKNKKAGGFFFSFFLFFLE